MKANNEKIKQKIKQSRRQTSEKRERLKEIETKYIQDRKNLIRKIELTEKRKVEFDKLRAKNILKLKTIRETNFNKTRYNKSMIDLQQKKRIENILFNEEEKFSRVFNKNNTIITTNNSRYSPLQKKTEKIYDLKAFLKEMNMLQNKSILKKSEKQRRQMYLNKIRREEELKKLEEEKKLDKLMGRN